MLEKNAYIVGVKNNEMIILLEFLIKNTDGVINYYYEVIFNITGDKSKFSLNNIISIKEVYDILQYIYNQYKENDVNKFKVGKETTEYIFKQFKNMILHSKYQEDDNNVTDNVNKSNSRRDNSFINMLNLMSLNDSIELDKDYKKYQNIIVNILLKNKR